MKEKIINFIREEIAIHPLESLEEDEDLLGNGILDSLGMMRMVVFLENEFQVKIPAEDLSVENFSCVQNITKYMTERLRDKEY